MLIDEYDIELSTPACDLSATIYTARVSVDADLSEVLPYINATVEKGEFLPGIPVLVWRERAHKYALRPREISISNVLDRDEASEEARVIVEKINGIWENRADLEPSFSTWTRLKALEVFKLLPRTNCGECGIPACMAFAVEVSKGKKGPEDCPPLAGGEYAEALASFREMGL
jgi:ArsR family metal-binding transcriptional regulator